MKIGALADATGTPVETIRFYEREGLMPPPARAANNYRLYLPAHVERLAFIRQCRSLDMTLDEIERLLDQGGELGKRLDFLIQELHREANTLGSKSAALELTNVSVEMKVAIEQMREQVQNLE